MPVYEQSFYLSIIFSIPAQTTAILPHLLPARAPLLKLGDDRPSLSAKPWIVILGLLHTLIAHHPSQTAYFDLIRATARAPTPHSKASTSSSHPGVDWVIRIAQALRRHMLIQLNLLTRPEAVDAIIISMFPSDTQANLDRETVTMSLYTLVRGIRSKAKNDAWKVLRSAYPQFDLGPNAPHSEGKTSGGSEGGGKVDDTRRWLVRVLSLDSEKSNTEGKASGNDTELTVERWFTEREKSGEVQRAGPNASGTTVEGRWVVKVKR
ncbi:uncharacterized protein STEHIDRAFT_161923 [Stereum hirsutum FP-91666 SS1]|uniref:uncharacterized protein n=1 Tax=Stereum hirsutum (strain FP-91666) TaxID=721885 RepID=UPI00044496F7|nr:uncharacterized protein STEHIDRAFT_161923 [Stereum hirsutum FP-91666 SS1]EIM81758.1 hypothetical protein STEHIDRAFT_161923 [Stereum hirsutum FP-91666 SS1]